MTYSPKYYQIRSKLLSLKNQLQNQNIKLADSKEYGCLKVALHRAKPNVKLKNFSSPIDVAEHCQNQNDINLPVIIENLSSRIDVGEHFQKRNEVTSPVIIEDLSSLIHDVTIEELISTKRALIDESDDLVRRLKAAGELLPYSKQPKELQQFVVEIWTVQQIINLKKK
jgi:hypothetical protein